MPFYIVTGRMGGGKSYMAAEEMRRALDEGAIVHTNLHIVPKEWLLMGYGDEIVQLPDDMSQWTSLIRPGAEGAENVVIIDEGALSFNAQDWNKGREEKRQVFEFMVYSRKLGLDVFFISQHEKNIDAQLRRMCTGVIRCVRAKDIKPFGPIFAALFGDFRRHYMDPNGSVEYEAKWASFDPEIGKLYKTESTHGKFANVARDVRRVRKSDQSAEGLKRRGMMFVGAVASCILLVGVVGTKALAYFSSPSAEAAAEQSVKPGAVTTVARVETPALPSAVSQPQAPPAEKEPRFVPRSGQGRDAKGRRYVDVSGQLVCIGSVFSDALVVSIVESGVIVELVLDDGRRIKTRPCVRTDSPPAHGVGSTHNNPTMQSKWKNSQSPSLPFLRPSSAALE